MITAYPNIHKTCIGMKEWDFIPLIPTKEIPSKAGKTQQDSEFKIDANKEFLQRKEGNKSLNSNQKISLISHIDFASVEKSSTQEFSLIGVHH
jgi:hypothetical protein